MSEAMPKHGAVYLQTVLQELERRGGSVADLNSVPGFNPSMLDGPYPTVPFDVFAGVFERAAEILDDDLFGLRLAEKRDWRRAGLISYVTMSSETLFHVISNLARFARVFSEAVAIDDSQLKSGGRVGWVYQVPARVVRRHCSEFGAASLVRELRRATNRDFPLAAVQFRHARNAGIAAIERAFGCEVTFAAPTNALVFRASDLELALPGADDELNKLLSGVAQERLGRKRSNAPHLVVEIERTLTSSLASGASQ